MPSNKDQNQIADVQGQADQRMLPIEKVGIRSIKHPVNLKTQRGELQQTAAFFDMFVDLAHNQKGTHMSRFVELLNDQDVELSHKNFTRLLSDMTAKLEARNGFINVSFDFFMEKTAPVSDAKSLMNYDISLHGQNLDGQSKVDMKVLVPVTSLCPCSKKVADYGAHNQRSHITVTIAMHADISFEEIISLVEAEASSELYGILKRSDEKYITEHAYDHPKFVEDLIRDIAGQLESHPLINGFKVEAENFESIHNHSAYAVISKPETA